jgi:hypothetical protein
MPGSGTLEKDWVDANFSYLINRLGGFSAFEPSDLLYDRLGTLDNLSEPNTGCKAALVEIFHHIGLQEVPVYFVTGLQNPGEFRYSWNNDQIIPEAVRISDRYKKIENIRVRGMAVGAVLSHEITHYCIMKKGILRDTTDNERLTDLGIFVLGLGKLYFNGGNPFVDQKQEELGYLTMLNKVYAFMKYQEQAKIPVELQSANLSPDAIRLLSFWRDKVNKEVKECLRRESLGERGEEKEDLLATGRLLDTNIRQTLQDLKEVQSSLATAIKNQNIINQTHSFWDIHLQDDRAMEEFTTGLKTASFEQDISLRAQTLGGIEHRLVRITKDVGAGNIDGKKKIIAELNTLLAGQKDLIQSLRYKISAATVAQDRCFNKVGMVRKVLNETKQRVHSCEKILGAIRARHRFLIQNREVWHPYMDERNLSVIIANLITTKQEEAYFSDVIRQSSQADTILSCKRDQYVAEFKNSPTISEYARMAQSRLDGVLEIERTLGSFLASQTTITDAYLDEINLLGSHLHSIQEAYAVNKADIMELKNRQDRIFRHHNWLNISPGDEKIFSEIVKETYSPGMETEMAHYVRVLTDIVDAGQSDAHRIMDLRESEKIIPIETHIKEYRKMAEGFQGFHSRIMWWKEIQEKYLDNIDRSEKSFLFRIKETVSGKIRRLF